MRGILLIVCGLLAALARAYASPSMPMAVAPDVYVLPAESAALGANVGIIVGPQGVAVVGTGTSAADGERILAAVARLTELPVALAINAYASPEHVLGNAAFARRGIPILAHRATADYMAANCSACLKRLQDQVGKEALAGTHPEMPQRPIEGSTTIVAGGRRLEILHYGPTQQAGSIAVLDPASGVLFAGGVASFDIVPDTRDAQLANWIVALDRMRHLPIKAVVPARGPVGALGRLAETRDYLAALERETRRAYQAGIGLFEAPAAVKLPRYAGWSGYPETHRRNVHFEYLRQEARDFAETAR